VSSSSSPRPQPSSGKHQKALSSAVPVVSPLSTQWAHNFSPPWDEVPAAVREKLNNKQRLQPKERRQVVRVVVDAVLKVCNSPRKTELEEVAKAMAEAYPESFVDRIGDDFVAAGYNDLLNRLCERRDNVNRVSAVTGPKKRSGESGDSQKVVKRRPKDSYGCVNWQPVIPEESDQLEQAKEQLKELFHSGSQVSGESTIDDGMKLTYPLQRLLINSGAKLSDVQENFPYLFTSRNLLKHFAELVGHDPYSVLVSAFRTKTKTLMGYLKSESYSGRSVPKSVFDDIESAHSDDRERALLPGIVLLVITYFKDTVEDFFHVTEVILW